ncbi:MAG: DUF4870 domain-containing protein [Deltaproteobacteria bacterium]|nr:DUF4870 domain-containing protein [Candidatus Zymogenaceae bacterium]
MTDEKKPSDERPSSEEFIGDAKEDIAAAGGAGSSKSSKSGGTKKSSGSKRATKPKAAPEAPKKPEGQDTVGDRNLALIAHLAGVLLYPAPGLNIIIPGLILILKGNEDAFVGHHARQSLIFQSIMTGAMILFTILSFVLIGLPVLLLTMVCHVVFVIIATFAASRGEWYTYPLMDRV